MKTNNFHYLVVFALSFIFYSFTPEKVLDIDGNMYHVVKIGMQSWMVENLMVSHYNNGDSIPNVLENEKWGYLTTGACCNYNNEISNGKKYGKLYNWYAIDDKRIIAPIGWHVATDEDWTTLTSYLGGEEIAAAKLQEDGTAHWRTVKPEANNEVGFSAIPAGSRTFDEGIFESIEDRACWWTATGLKEAAWIRDIFDNEFLNIFRRCGIKSYGHSVRCVKDD